MWFLQLPQMTLYSTEDECGAPPPTVLKEGIRNYSQLFGRDINKTKENRNRTSFSWFNVTGTTNDQGEDVS